MAAMKLKYLKLTMKDHKELHTKTKGDINQTSRHDSAVMTLTIHKTDVKMIDIRH